MIEKRQHIPRLLISKNGEMIHYSLDGIVLDKSVDTKFYTLSSIAKTCKVPKKAFESFIQTQKFQACAKCFINDFKMSESVYLIDYGRHIVKIGRTFNINERYPPSVINNLLVSVVPVSNMEECERKLIAKFKSVFTLHQGNEFFKVPDVEGAANVFNSIAEKYRVDESNDNKYIKYYSKDKKFGTCIMIHPELVPILLSLYSKYSDYNQIINTFELIERETDKVNINDFASTFEESESRFYYWKFNGYTVIVDIKNDQINASRLWNSICESQNITPKPKLSVFLKSKFMSNVMKLHPEIKIESRSFRDKPLLNGKYLPSYFAHFIVHQLDAKYAVEVAKRMTNIFFKQASSKPINGGSSIPKFMVNAYRKFFRKDF